MPKYEVTSGGHMVRGAFYPRGSTVELTEQEAAKFKNAFKPVDEKTALTAPQPINPGDPAPQTEHV